MDDSIDWQSKSWGNQTANASNIVKIVTFNEINEYFNLTESGIVKYGIIIPPGGWFKLPGKNETIINKSDESETYDGEINVNAGQDFEIEIGIIGEPAIDATTSFKIVSFTPNTNVFEEPFTALASPIIPAEITSEQIGGVYTYSCQPGSFSTTNNLWDIEFLKSRRYPYRKITDKTVTLSIDNGLTIEIDRTSYTDITFLSSAAVTCSSNSAAIKINSEMIGGSPNGSETGYYGMWVIGSSGYDLWINLSEWVVELADISRPPPPWGGEDWVWAFPYINFPASDFHGNTDYQFIIPDISNPSELNIDLSEFSDYLGEEILGLKIEAFIYSLMS